MMSNYIFLDPDGTQEFGVYVVVLAPTGVMYAHQCAGYLNDLCEAEGFLVPLGGTQAAQKLESFFRRFKGNPPRGHSGSAWESRDLQELATIVSEIVFWRTVRDGDGTDERLFLEVDYERVADLTEGWIPVKTPYGRGIVLHKNSD
jgi:hypothetical protein